MLVSDCNFDPAPPEMLLFTAKKMPFLKHLSNLVQALRDYERLRGSSATVDRGPEEKSKME